MHRILQFNIAIVVQCLQKEISDVKRPSVGVCPINIRVVCV